MRPIVPYEAVLMANVTNGARAETYVVPAGAGSGRLRSWGRGEAVQPR